MSKISIELHLVAELEHQTDFLFFRSGSETAILGIEKYRFAVNATNGLQNYQKWLLVLNKIIFCDFSFFLFPRLLWIRNVDFAENQISDPKMAVGAPEIG